MHYGVWTCYPMWGCYITMLSETLRCKDPRTRGTTLWLCYSLVGITLLLLLTNNLGVYVATSNEVSHIHWHPRKLNLRVTQLSSISFPNSYLESLPSFQGKPQLARAMHAAVLLWVCFQLLLTQGCEGVDSSGANLVSQQLMHRARGDNSAGSTCGKM